VSSRLEIVTLADALQIAPSELTTIPVRAPRAPSCLKFDRFEWFGDEVGASVGGV